MSLAAADRIARAVLYEGYLLYPYYPSATKNRQRWTFGTLYPRRFVERNPGSDASLMQAECLLESSLEGSVEVRVRFLQLAARPSEGTGASWTEHGEAREREIVVPAVKLAAAPVELEHEFTFAAEESEERGVRRSLRPLSGRIEVSVTPAGGGRFRVRARVCNASDADPESRSEALLASLVSAHALLKAERAGFVSSIDPAPEHREAVTQCRNVGVWPVLLGEPGERSLMLASPIILYDHPRIAPESPGDLFDGTEIDEILSLRILTLTDEEKALVRAADDRGKRLLERTEGLTEEDWMKLHGRLRETDHGFSPGDRVRIRPKGRSDALDIVLDGMTARIEAIEQSLEGQAFLSVSLDDDPGRDLGALGQPGHRFFFRVDEVERL